MRCQQERDLLDFSGIFNQNTKEFIKKDLYPKNPSESSLIPENSKARFFQHIPIVINIQDYEKVANRLISDKELCQKITSEFKFVSSFLNKTNFIDKINQ